MSGLMKFAISNRWTGDVQFTAEIEADDNTPLSIKVGLAVKWGVKNRANLSGANLCSADLSGADLCSADLRRANLRSANLSGADLSGADLSDANLSDANPYRANLYRANLTDANLRSANLTDANLCSADLRRANLTDANLTDANLTDANLIDANLRSANLTDANLYRANLYRANLTDAKNAELVIARTRILPDGDIIGWKKCKNGVIVKLLVPAAAKRSHAFGRKCRAEYVDVLEVFGSDKGVSMHDWKTEYIPGHRVTPDSFSDNWQEECANGVHFYISRIEAEAHQ